jgi:hypothetical protein
MNDETSEEKEIAAPEYIRANFHPSDRIAVLVRNRKRGETVQRITTADRIAKPQFQDWLHYKNEKDGCDVYIGMNALKREAHTRTKDDIQTIRHLYLDLDHEGPKALAAVEKSELVPPPSYVLKTSTDKFQVIWKVEELQLEHAEALLHALARDFDGDPAATDSTRVLRLPGFANKKYAEDFIVKIHSHTDRTYHPRDFKLRTEPVDSEHPRPNLSRHRPGPSAPQQLSQSERDWAYAKRALARGVPPEEIMRDIAEFRGNEKYDPQDYARRTVTKAAADLKSESASQTLSPPSTNENNRDLQH